ncbi:MULTISPECIES: SIS domain-containing protein [Mesorhizobium]|uniref:Glutamine--fructose-6-phosphate aminotransferase [isomerizing] n=1 Tax=Mesorhizobium qingshengii TaxID=1165689 RepID=A0A1G5ZWU3_9HYPH|nr:MULTISPECIES: SIS domain-containing protein [Mesorhizobium]AID34982.1 SIS domain-containing protein [Mesorhizobium huakuii 7653R]MCH4560643.1 SIS domain-containing protein [Mesorhizobium jarvisii]SDA99087.1 SIS domain-containing protein [Mesorhizobium qingshengii]
MDLEKTFMLKEIAMQADFVRSNLDEMLAAVRATFSNVDPLSFKHGFIIGCGDSYFASLAVREFMMRATGLFVEPVEALEFSRYLVHYLPKDAFVFGVSNSGTVSRTIEGIKLARGRGAKTFAVTVSEDSNLAKAAETLVKVNAVPNIKTQADGTRITTPGTLSYTASLLGLYIASIVLGERNGHLSKQAVDRMITELRTVADKMSEAEQPTAKIAEEVAASFKRDRQFVIAGGGPNFATAHFSAAKWLEALNKASHVAQLEEWAHIQYFMTDETVDTVILLPPGVGRDRGLEQARAAHEMGSRVIIVGESADADAISASDIFFPMPPGIPEVYTPFVYKLPAEYLSCHVAIQQKRRFFGFDNAKREEVNHRQIFHSAQTAAAK